MREGDRVIVLDNSGWEIETVLLSVDRDSVEGEVVRRRLAGSEPRTKISLHQGVLRSSRLEYVLQKGTELGVVEFAPVITDRCIMSDLETVEKKRRRWESIIQESAEQCRRSRKPVLRAAVLLQQAFEQVSHGGGLSLILWEGDDGIPIRDALRGVSGGEKGDPPPFSVSLFVGPEGGFSPGELDTALRYGLVPVTMGPRILRAETAGVVAAALVLYELGDMR
jgi:16S rRNA (uracil1498-N3)-methyltransferase